MVAKRSPITTMFTSRGCPFHCAFCSRPHLGKGFRYRSAGNVVDEMEECLKLGIHEVLVYDDTFTVNRARAMAVCDEIIKRNLDIGWDIRARVDYVDEKLLKKLKEAHCERIHYGVEAGTDRILKVLNNYDVYEDTKREHLLPDHKFPEIRWDDKTREENREDMSDDEIKQKFQLKLIQA